MTPHVAPWVEVLVSLSLLASGASCLVGAIGLLRMPYFLQRMHPATLAFTLGSWGAALASSAYFTALDGELALYPWLVPVLLSITAPVTTVLIARAELFRARQAGRDPGR